MPCRPAPLLSIGPAAPIEKRQPSVAWLPSPAFRVSYFPMRRKPKLHPPFHDKAEERQFWESHDSSDYVDWSQAERVRLPNLRPSTKSISLGLPVALLERIKIAANKRDVPYQSLIKTWLAEKTDAD